MPRVASKLLFAAVLSALLLACNKAPAPAAASPSTTPAAAAAVKVAPVSVTYQCHSPQKSRDIFVRFDDHGALYLGADAGDMKATGDIVLFDKSGMASWSKKLPNGTETSSFNKNTGEWTWEEASADRSFVDQAQYQCKAI